jgi:release factor glutamine methyltransferase
VEEAAAGSWPFLLDEPVSERASAYFSAMVDRRATGEPLQYVLGRWSFRQLELVVDRRVLIPRPETEQVVEVALAELAALGGVRPVGRVGSARDGGAAPAGSRSAGGASSEAAGTDSEAALAGRPGMAGPEGRELPFAVGPVISARAVGASDAVISVAAAAPAGGAGPVVVDLGTGSGAIALSIAAEGGAGAVWATDVSADALAIARANLVGLGGVRAAAVRLVEGWWWDALPASLKGRVSLVVSNPPYVTTAEMSSLPAVVADWEPERALHAGPHGLEAIEVIVAGAPEWLARPGVLVVELAPHQASAAVALAQAAGFHEIRVAQDLAGRDRALVARLGR